MTAAVGARNFFEVDAGVVHALLQARYYDGSKGEFLSEDPVFWGKQSIPDPQAPTSWRTAGNASNSAYANTQQKGNPTSGWSDAYMRDPQQQNSYSYSRDNPINYSDATGLWGVFLTGGAGAEGGLGEGGAASLQSGIGFTIGDSTKELGAFSSYGGLVGGPFQSTTVEGNKGIKNSPYGVLGANAGVNVGVTITNANKISDLRGTNASYNIGIGIASVSWSNSNGIWTMSFSIGAKPSLSYSVYPSTTQTATAVSTGNAHTACGRLCK